MNIKIAERLRPYSHSFGTYCILPGSLLRLQIFPSRMMVHQLTNVTPLLMAEIPIPIKGPVHEFTVQLDLERVGIYVWGKNVDGFFRYKILATQNPSHLALQVEKGLESWVPNPVIHQEAFQINPAHANNFQFSIDRLSLGNHKSQDWDMVKRRQDLTEILPSWLRLGQLVTLPQEISFEGTATLLKACQNASKLEAYDAFRNLFSAGFGGILSPRLIDEEYQGFDLPQPEDSLSPLLLLTEGAKAIRSLFVQVQQNEIFVLPNLPPQFHCGRFLNIRCDGVGFLDMEWTKKAIRRMIFQSAMQGFIQFHLQKVHQFRLNGEIHSASQPIKVEKDQVYLFDRFQ